MLYLGIFGLKVSKTTVIFEMSAFEFVWLLNFVKKQKCLNLGPKMPYLGVFRVEFFKKSIVTFEINSLEFV